MASTWMERVDLTGMGYVGGDIVPSIVERNNQLHSRQDRRFISLDLTADRGSCTGIKIWRAVADVKEAKCFGHNTKRCQQAC